MQAGAGAILAAVSSWQLLKAGWRMILLFSQKQRQDQIFLGRLRLFSRTLWQICSHFDPWPWIPVMDI